MCKSRLNRRGELKGTNKPMIPGKKSLAHLALYQLLAMYVRHSDDTLDVDVYKDHQLKGRFQGFPPWLIVAGSPGVCVHLKDVAEVNTSCTIHLHNPSSNHPKFRPEPLGYTTVLSLGPGVDHLVPGPSVDDVQIGGEADENQKRVKTLRHVHPILQLGGTAKIRPVATHATKDEHISGSYDRIGCFFCFLAWSFTLSLKGVAMLNVF